MPRNATSFIVDRVEFPGNPGAIMFTRRYQDRTAVADQEIIGFVHTCPCGCGIWSGVHFKNYDSEPMWDRAGDDLHMTVTPSIGIHHIKGGQPGYHWHGYLRNGVFEEC
jgi:hypothetical protein